MIIREILVEPQAIAWLPWAVSYFFFIGLACCSVLTALFFHFIKKSRFELIALSLALSCAIVAPVALTADLHQPARIMNFYLNSTIWSWMYWGSWFLPLFVFSVLGYFICSLCQNIQIQSIPKYFHWLYWGKFNIHFAKIVFVWFSLVMTILILMYTTMEVFTVQARPLWHQPWLLPLLIFSALPVSLSVCHYFMYQIGALRYFTMASLLGLIGSIWGIYLFSEQTAIHLIKLWQISYSPTLLLFGIILLFVLLLLPNSTLINLLRILTALCVAWLTRWILLIEVQQIAKYNALVNPYNLNWSVDGLIGIISVFSLWLLVGITLWQLLSHTLLQSNWERKNHE
ncbi:tetrathionate reductase subunit C [Canicola haemoglobinophilus]|uniref:Tetrathionate reductase subunit C n=1 Tax=Canicola haemoglobinophilus TaxID=733 RepID=A0A1V4AZ07_9PAST|nr:NrfD/PsrC family molybdoenzyme membrane anchor subunit [Canicola haemoglobinophilus]OOR98052.1 tetrathionate reductase subunit C [Canicola haemoglobinophilus]STO53969.1 tetrathionate reductase subunit C [Canicola haemoglobinophilus]STO60594.1 tetrathionate reductase subunit C [Canicola haemoglobinophilus]STO68502.1 tetrathionate reductase subunit C [Canicola haemoglobinophilus]